MPIKRRIYVLALRWTVFGTYQSMGDVDALIWTLHASSCAYASTYAYAFYATVNKHKSIQLVDRINLF